METRKCLSKKDELCLRLSLSIFCSRFIAVIMFVKLGDNSSWYCVFGRGIVVRFPASTPRLAVGPTQPPMQQISGVGYFFLRVKRPERETEHVTKLSAEVKNDYSCTSFPPMPSWRAPPHTQP